MARLKRDLQEKGYEFREVPYAHFGAASDAEKVHLTLYKSGKLVIQGKGTTDFIQFYLEPCLLGEARLGYEHLLDPAVLAPRIGVDESGKGDFFGPLVAAGVYLEEHAAKKMLELGVKDSKLITSDARIQTLANAIRAIAKWDVVVIGNEKYNELQKKMRTVNNLLGWMHARVIENLLAKTPDCPTAISDQFGNKRIVQNALMERGRKIQLIQRHKAESDLAVAAASILARDEFVRRLQVLSKQYGVPLPKGASAAVRAAAVELVKKHGPAVLPQVAKMHFRTSQQVLAEAAA
jgi:ribonuclease HIII